MHKSAGGHFKREAFTVKDGAECVLDNIGDSQTVRARLLALSCLCVSYGYGYDA